MVAEVRNTGPAKDDGGHAPSMEEFTFASAGRLLAGRVFRPEPESGRAPGLLFVHGLDSNQEGYEARAEAVTASLGVICLSFDLSGHGRSGGQFADLRPVEHLADVQTAYDQLVAAGADRTRIGVCGASYGAYLSCLLVAERPVRKLLLRAPALYDDAALEVVLSRRPRSVAGPRRSSALASLARFDGEVLILESERDEVIDHAVIERYLAASRGARHELLAGATHALTRPEWKETFLAAIVRWFADL